jgi:hypothetical protein
MIDDEILIAFADGELAPERRRAIEAALAADPELRARLERQQSLRARISAHYAPVAEEPVPERFAALLSAAGADEKVVSLAERRQARARPMWQNLTALAATLVLGLFAGSLLPQGDGGGGSGPVAVEDGALVARGTLADALETQLASEQEGGAATRIGVTFAAADGAVCRTFDAAALSGLACRSGEDWRIVTAAGTEGDAGSEYRQASSAGRRVLEAAQDMMAGDPFDAQAERRARDAGWRNPAARD